MTTKKNYEILYVIGLTNRGVFMNAFPVRTTEKSHVLVDITQIPSDIINKYINIETNESYQKWMSFYSLYVLEPDSTIRGLDAVAMWRYNKTKDYNLQFWSDGIVMWGTDLKLLHETFFNILTIKPEAKEVGNKQEIFAKGIVDYFKYN